MSEQIDIVGRICAAMSASIAERFDREMMLEIRWREKRDKIRATLDAYLERQKQISR